MDEGQLTQYLAVADLVLDEAVFNPKPEVVSFTYDATKEKYVHGIGVAFKDTSGKIIDDNPTPIAVAALAEPLSKIAVDNLDQWDAKSKRYVPARASSTGS